MAAEILREFQPDPELCAIANKRSNEVKKREVSGLKLYALGPSICSQRARLVIEEKQLPYDEHTVDFSISENLEPWYLELNPRGVVPTIVESGRSLFDSYFVMLYVNNQFAGPELTPDDDAEYGDMIASMKRADFFPIRDFAYRFERVRDDPDVWRVAMHERVKEYREKYPELKHIYDKKLEDYASMNNKASDKKAMAKLEIECNAILDDLDAALGKHEWIVSDTFTLADIAWLPIFLRFQRLGINMFDGDSLRLNINRFVLRWQKRASYKPAIEGALMNMLPQMPRLLEDAKKIT